MMQNDKFLGIESLLENPFLTLVIKDFQHWLLTDVETTDINLSTLTSIV